MKKQRCERQTAWEEFHSRTQYGVKFSVAQTGGSYLWEARLLARRGQCWKGTNWHGLLQLSLQLGVLEKKNLLAGTKTACGATADRAQRRVARRAVGCACSSAGTDLRSLPQHITPHHTPGVTDLPPEKCHPEKNLPDFRHWVKGRPDKKLPEKKTVM